MDKKALKKALKKLSSKSTTKVEMADDAVVEFFKPLLDEMDQAFGTESAFTTDEASFSFNGTGSYIVGWKETEYFSEIFKETFGVTVTKEILEQPYKEFLPWLSKNRTVFNSTYKRKPFLGISKIIDHTSERYGIAMLFALKGQCDYWTGFLFGKTTPEGKKAQDALAKEHAELKIQVYGVNSERHMLVETVEGDKLMFANIYETCCWIEARASNYNPKVQKLENW